jgi:hypothetical protein
MVHPKAMGIGAMFVLLILAVVLLPMIVRYIGKNEPYFSISGFTNQVSYTIPSTVSSSQPSYYVPDPNTNYICRSPKDSGYTPCKEGTFCDGPSNLCVDLSPPSDIDISNGFYQ